MSKTACLISVILFINISLSAASDPRDSIDIAPFGKVFIYKHSGVPGSVAIMISGDGGWKYGVVDFAESFSRDSTLVIGIDILRYLRSLRKREDDCYEVASDFVKLATVIEKRYGFADYLPPVIMGYSSGATLVYGILAQARPGAFAGGISLGFCPDMMLPKKLCEINGLIAIPDSTGKNIFLQPDARLTNKWIVLHGKLDKVCNYSETAAFVSKTSDAELITLPEVGHGFAKQSNFMPQWKEAFRRLTEK